MDRGKLLLLAKMRDLAEEMLRLAQQVGPGPGAPVERCARELARLAAETPPDAAPPPTTQ